MVTNLSDYGIHNEKSDLRVHVCYKIKRLYIYPTQCGIDAINNNSFPKRAAYQMIDGKKTITAMGFLVPPIAIANCNRIELPSNIWELYSIGENNSTTNKGSQAANVVACAAYNGFIPIPLNYEFGNQTDIQIAGIDVIVFGDAKIQVKCDYNGGSKKLGGTGNLYLQIAESNPLKRY